MFVKTEPSPEKSRKKKYSKEGSLPIASVEGERRSARFADEEVNKYQSRVMKKPAPNYGS